MAKQKSLKTLANEMMAEIYSAISYELNPRSLKIVKKYFKLVREKK
jgi:hypothetical protein